MLAADAPAASTADRAPSVSRFITVEEDERRRAEEDERLERGPRWLQIALLALSLAGIVALVAYLMRPPSADKLFDAIEAIAADEKPGRLLDAKDDIRRFMERFPDDPHGAKLKGYLEEIDLLHLERQTQQQLHAATRRWPRSSAIISKRSAPAARLPAGQSPSCKPSSHCIQVRHQPTRRQSNFWNSLGGNVIGSCSKASAKRPRALRCSKRVSAGRIGCTTKTRPRPPPFGPALSNFMATSLGPTPKSPGQKPRWPLPLPAATNDQPLRIADTLMCRSLH